MTELLCFREVGGLIARQRILSLLCPFDAGHVTASGFDPSDAISNCSAQSRLYQYLATNCGLLAGCEGYNTRGEQGTTEPDALATSIRGGLAPSVSGKRSRGSGLRCPSQRVAKIHDLNASSRQPMSTSGSNCFLRK